MLAFLLFALGCTVKQWPRMRAAVHDSFKFGRTETIRSASIQSDAFVRAADDPSVSVSARAI